MTIPSRHHARAAVLALILLTLGAWWIPPFLSAERYRRHLEAGLERKLMHPVTFGALSYRLLPRPGFTIYNVVVKDDPRFGAEPFARVERIACDLRWRSLWRSKLDLAALHLTRPTFTVVRSAGGEWNIENFLHRSGIAAPGNLGPPPDDLQRRDIDLDADDGRLNFKLGVDKKPFAVSDLEARLRIERGRGVLRFRLEGNPIRTDVGLTTPGKLELAGEWTPGQDLDGPLDATLRTRGSLLYNWVPLLTGRNPELYGVLDFGTRLTGSLRSLKIEGQGRLSQLHRWESLPPSDSLTVSLSVRGGFDRRRGKAECESLDVSFADSRLHLTGSVEKIPSSPEVDLVLAFERSRLEDLLALGHRLSGLSGGFGVFGRVDGLVTIQGPWHSWRYGGFADARNVRLRTSAGTFPVSDLNLSIENQEARLAPASIALTPRVELGVEGMLRIARPGPKAQAESSVYDMVISTKAVPLHDLAGLARDRGVRVLQGFEAEGALNSRFHLTGLAWPPAAPSLSGSAELKAVRVLVPGVSEPIDLAEARIQVNGDRIVADPLVAVIGSSTFSGRLEHQGERSRAWTFNLHSDKLSLEEGWRWFDAIDRPSLLERIPGLGSFTARRTAGATLFSALSAQGSFATPTVKYRSMTLTDFRTSVEVSGSTIRLSKARFRAAGGRGEGTLQVNLGESPASVTADTSLEDAKVQAFATRFPASLQSVRGLFFGRGHFKARGLTRQELADNLQGDSTIQLKNIAFGGFDPLVAVARATPWGELDPGRGDVVLPSVTAFLQIQNRHVTLSHSPVEISGARLRVSGNYGFNGITDLDVHVDFQHVSRRWIDDASGTTPEDRVANFHLTGPLDSLVIVPGVQVGKLATNAPGR